jgi:hypothetical protein
MENRIRPGLDLVPRMGPDPESCLDRAAAPEMAPGEENLPGKPLFFRNKRQ